MPQHRHRVIFIGFRADHPTEWSFPKPTHADLNSAAIRKSGQEFLPWLTLQKAIRDLPEPSARPSRKWHNHILQSGSIPVT